MSAPPLLVVITGPAGVGKDAVLARLKALSFRPRGPQPEGLAKGHLQSGGAYHFAVTATTRPRRPQERPGIDYHFLSNQEFEELLSRGEFLESAVVYGHRYGVPKAPLRAALQEGQDVLLRTDVQGAAYIKSRLPQAVTIFLAPPSLAELERRLRARASDDPQQMELRLRIARQEMERAHEFDHVVVNERDRLDEAVAAIERIIAEEKGRPQREAVHL